MFWSISVGIVIGAGLIPLAVFGSIFIGIVMVIFINRKSTDDPYILLINCADDNGEQLVKNAVELSVKKYMIRSKTVSPKGIELTIEVRLKT